MELRKLKDKATEAFTKGRFSKAAEFYEEYCRADPKDHQSRLRTGDAWAKAGQRDRAIAAYQAAAEGFAREGFLPRAIAASKLILELDPEHRGVQQMLADLYARRASPAGAKARGPGGGALSFPPAPAPPVEPPAKSRLPDEVRAAVAEIELDVEVDGPEAEEVVVHSVSVGGDGAEGERSHATEISLEVEAADEPILMGEPVEDGREAEPVVVGEELVPDTAPVTADSGAVAAPWVPEPGVSAVVAAAAEPLVSAPVVRPATSSMPPGLAPRASQRGAVPATSRPASSTLVTPAASQPPPSPMQVALAPAAGKGSTSGKWQALSSPIAAPTQDSGAASPPAPVASEALASAAPPGLRPRRAEPQASAGATVPPSRGPSPDLGVSLRAAAGPSSFTELELEADSLLHAVELAAQSGVSQRAAMAVPASAADEEEVYSLTEEVGPEGRSLDELPTVPLFSDLPRDAFIELFERCPLRRFGPGELIIEQGTRGDAFYVICEGSVRVFRVDHGQRQDLATLEGGACFGEMALLSGAPRTASVEGASEDTQLLEISAPVLAELSRRYPLVARALKKFVRQRMLTNVMNTSALFRPFNRKDRRTLVERFRARDVERDAVIIRDGDRTDGLYVVLSGEVEVSKDGILLTRLKEGDLFGEISLLQKTPATATVTATRHTTLLRLPREDFDMLISSHPQILVLISELSDERLQRTQKVLGAAVSGQPGEIDEDLILV